MVVQLQARDGHVFKAYATGSGASAIVLVQEIFGVNAHIRAVSERFAQSGYQVLSPALFDRVDPSGEFGLELDYSAASIQRGQRLAAEVGYWDAPLLDIEACVESFPADTPVAVVGYCWGGGLAWLAAVRLPGVRAAVGYYGGGIARHLDPPPRVPVMLHFGERDPHIPLADVEKIRAANVHLPVFTYAAGHGFNCDMREDYQAEAAELAWQRTADFLVSNSCSGAAGAGTDVGDHFGPAKPGQGLDQHLQ